MVLRVKINSTLQRPAKKYANIAKQEPDRDRQSSKARAGTNFLQPLTTFLADLCTPWSIKSVGMFCFALSMKLGCMVASASAQRLVKHYKQTWQNITTDRTVCFCALTTRPTDGLIDLQQCWPQLVGLLHAKVVFVRPSASGSNLFFFVVVNNCLCHLFLWSVC